MNLQFRLKFRVLQTDHPGVLMRGTDVINNTFLARKDVCIHYLPYHDMELSFACANVRMRQRMRIA